MTKLTEEMIVARTRSSDLKTIKKLNCWGSELSDVGIIRYMKNVEVLSLSVNNISTLEPFHNCLQLKELYIRKNCIQDIREVCYLKDLPHLQNLWLADNPCADTPGYRSSVLRALPQLQRLDDITVQPEEIKDALKTGIELTLPSPDEEEQYLPIAPPVSMPKPQQPQPSPASQVIPSLPLSPPQSEPERKASIPEASSRRSSLAQAAVSPVVVSNQVSPEEPYPAPSSSRRSSASSVHEADVWRRTEISTPATIREDPCPPVQPPEQRCPIHPVPSMVTSPSSSSTSSLMGQNRPRNPGRHSVAGEPPYHYVHSGLDRVTPSEAPYTHPGAWPEYGQQVQQAYLPPHSNGHSWGWANPGTPQSSATTPLGPERVSPTRSVHSRPRNRGSNLLMATLCLVQELDFASLEVVSNAIRNRMEELDD